MQSAAERDRARELERVYQSRRGHAPQISISDDSHHVTEAIGDMYGNDDYNKRDSRPLSFISSPLGDNLESRPFDLSFTAPPKSPLRQISESPSPPPSQANGSPTIATRKSSVGRGSPHSPLSPTLSRANSSDTAQQQFPLNDIDYESSPAAVAQELSNLQAIRRMSMDVNTSDPDLPAFRVPTVAPQHFSEDEDPSKLFWVPARLHPELAPKEFKTFIEEKVDKIRRRSGDSDSLSPDGPLGRQGSAGGLRRKKSMLSRQIDSPNGYRDGAERLERKKSGSATHLNSGLGKLQELEHLVEDPSSLVQRVSLDSHSGAEVGSNEDLPILPVKPAGVGTLKRSTRTNYRRGSLRKGERVPFSRRVAARQSETDGEESPATSPTHPKHPSDAPFNVGITRVQSEPIHRDGAENFSRPGRKRTNPARQQSPVPADEAPIQDRSTAHSETEQRTPQKARPFHSRIASNGRTTAPLPGYPPQQVPQIIETPPPQEPPRMQLPERHSSRGPPPPSVQQQAPPQPIQQQAPPRAPSQPQQHLRQQPGRIPLQRGASPIKPTTQTFDDLIGQPTPLPGNSTRTDNLSIIPNLVEEKKPDKKHKDKKDGSEGGTRKTSWGWLLGSDDKEKGGDKKDKEERERELAKKVKNKLSKSSDKTHDKAHDNTRLDVLQSSIDGGRGRESLVLDRDSIRLEEERKKESSRKSSGSDSKKEKESGLFSSIFGGGKKKGDRESGHKKGSSMRGLSPDPPPRILKPDIDYNWTRFSILEERAIYRMAHIKLANPRRELYSQVLLSNFMYSYLAKVQQMHPQIQIGHQGQQKQAQMNKAQQAQQKKEQQQQQQQPEEFNTYQKYQQQQQRDDSNSQNNPSDPVSPDGLTNADIHGNGNGRPDSRAEQYKQQGHSNGGYAVASGQSYLGAPAGGGKGQPYYGSSGAVSEGEDGEDDMW